MRDYYVKKYGYVMEVPLALWQDHEAISTWMLAHDVIAEWAKKHDGLLKSDVAVISPRTWELRP